MEILIESQLRRREAHLPLRIEGVILEHVRVQPGHSTRTVCRHPRNRSSGHSRRPNRPRHSARRYSRHPRNSGNATEMRRKRVWIGAKANSRRRHAGGKSFAGGRRGGRGRCRPRCRRTMGRMLMRIVVGGYRRTTEMSVLL